MIMFRIMIMPTILRSLVGTKVKRVTSRSSEAVIFKHEYVTENIE